MYFSFTCMFCEKEFKEWQTLKDHMRKKSHKRIDPKNKKYDKYYLINYLVSVHLYLKVAATKL